MKADEKGFQPPSGDGPVRGPAGGRWIRPDDSDTPRGGRALPAGGASPSFVQPSKQPAKPVSPGDSAELPPSGNASSDALADLLMDETRERLSQLSKLEREIEDRVRERWKKVEEELREREARLKEQLNLLAGEAQLEAREARARAQKEGRTEGFRDGFEKGVEEGKRLGFEQGRIDGVREGRIVGRREEEVRFRDDASAALDALLDSAAEFRGAKDNLLREAQDGVVALSVQIAQKIIDREVRIDPQAVLGPAGKAVEQIFRGCEVTLELNPEDTKIVESALREDSRWAEYRRHVKLEPSEDVERGGCRLVSSGGVVDATIRSQLQIIGDALRGAGLNLESEDIG